MSLESRMSESAGTRHMRHITQSRHVASVSFLSPPPLSLPRPSLPLAPHSPYGKCRQDRLAKPGDSDDDDDNWILFAKRQMDKP